MERFTSVCMTEGIDVEDYLIGSYFVGTNKDVDIFKYAENVVVEQTTGTWLAVPEETVDVKMKHGGRVLSIFEIPAYETMIPPEVTSRQFILRLAFPIINFGNNIPMMLSSMFGNISSFGTIKLLDIEFPEKYVGMFKGPKFGVQGIRQILKVYDRPLLLNMIKPCTGFSPEVGAKLFYEAASGGLDIIKDDELLANPPFCPLETRVKKYMEQCKRVFEETGKTVLYTANVTDRPDRIYDNARKAIDAGANALMLNYVTAGLASIETLAEASDIQVPILGHSDFGGAFSESPFCGVSSALLQGKLARLLGLDMVLVLNPYGKFPMLRDQYLRTFYNLTGPLYKTKTAFPVLGGGTHPGQVGRMMDDLGTDFIIGAGGAIHGHPMGPRAGTRAFFQCIKAMQSEKSLDDAAQHNEELRVALEIWK